MTSDGDALTGLEPNGSTNLEFDPSPKLQFVGVPTLQDGRVVVTGATQVKHKYFLAVARYKASGRLDPTFGTRGSTEIKRIRVGVLQTSIRTQSDGKLLIAADSGLPGASALARLLPNGRLDTHFGRGGIVTFADPVSALALQGDGKALVGEARDNGSTLYRLLGGNNCVVPGLRSKTLSQATATLTHSYCRRGQVSRRFSTKVARGRAISTVPPKNARLPGGATVDLVVSRGRRP